MSTEEKALQSTLLRLVILCSSGLASLVSSSSSSSELHLTFASSSQSIPTHKHFASLRRKIRQDALQLFTEAGKRATSLGIALKPSKSQVLSQSTSVASSPIEYLDKASISAAQRQIDDWSSEIVPKLIFLANKSWKEAQVCIEEEAEGGPAEPSRKDKEERDRMKELAERMGGVVMTGAELRGDGSTKVYRRPANLGLGRAWAKILQSQVGQILQAIASTAEACLDQRARAAIQAAAEARDRREHLAVMRSTPSSPGGSEPKTVKDLRRDCLEKVAGVLDACDNAVKLLPETNLEAIKARWKDRGELLEDGLEELTSATAAGKSDGFKEEDALEPDLSPRKAALARRLGPLLKIGRLAHDRILDNHITAAHADGDLIDLGNLDDSSDLLSTLQDDLIAAVTWDDFDQLEEEEEESEDLQEGGEEEAAVGGGSGDSPAMKAKRICHEYCQVIQSFSNSVPDDEKIKVMAEEMRKLVEGIADADWEAAMNDEET